MALSSGPSLSSNTRRRSIAFFVTVCILLCGLAIALNVGWILLTWREVLTLIGGLILFLVIISGLILNTTYLVKEIRRSEQQDAFLNAMTHELKTPLASIRLYLETLQQRDVGEAKRKEFYAIMLEDSDRLLKTIEQVLQAGRVSKSKQSPQRVEIDLTELAQACVTTARRQHHLSDESLRLADLPQESMRVMGDREELSAAISNLIDNAVKYSPQNVRITVELRRWDEKHLAVRVRDEGIGIAKQELRQIFGRFYRIPAVASRIKGNGLGLFIVHTVAKKHGGKAFADSPGQGLGSTFTITLPAVGS